MEQKVKLALAESMQHFRLPRFEEIPDVGLYLEQTTKYIAGYLEPLEGVSITTSMVSNYVKQKLIPGPTKKAYYQDSIAYLIFLSYIKTVMPLEDIRLMMQVQKSSYQLQVAYDYFCDELENLLQYVCGLRDTPAVVGTTRTQEKELLRTALMSITYKIYLDQYLNLIRQETA